MVLILDIVSTSFNQAGEWWADLEWTSYFDLVFA